MPHNSVSGGAKLGDTESRSRRETNVSKSGYLKLRECRYCDKKFIHGGHRNEHEKAVHLKQKPYACRFCDRTFGHFSGRTRHEKAHHKAKR